MSEDEFVVLAEHAGLVESYDGSEREYVEHASLLAWLEREGAVLLKERFLKCDEDEELLGDLPRMARLILDRMVEKRWLSPVAIHEGAEMRLYALRMSTTDAYRIYVEKDVEATLSSRSWSGRSLLDVLKAEHGEATTPCSSVGSTQDEEVSDALRQLRIREKMWQDCFPTCSESCKQLYFSFESPVVVMYATLGLNLIGNGISSVPAFSRELKGMDITHEDRSVIIGFLSRAFPCE